MSYVGRFFLGLFILSTLAFLFLWGKDARINGFLRGTFEREVNQPIRHSLTRAALYDATSDRIHFSTLESYHKNPPPDRCAWVTHSIVHSVHHFKQVTGSSEVRSWVYSDKLNTYILLASLDPKVFQYNAVSDQIKPVFSSKGMWIHQGAVSGQFLYVILSSPLEGSLSKKIVKIDLTSYKSKPIILDKKNDIQFSYGGVQTIDPLGNIWFWTGYPLQLMWITPDGRVSKREGAGYLKQWTLESWDDYQGKLYYLFSNTQQQILKIPQDGSRPEPGIFLDLIPVDLYRTKSLSLRSLYFNPKTHTFYKRTGQIFEVLGSLNIGILNMIGFEKSSEFQETPLKWKHPEYGDIDVMDVNKKRVLVWLTGRKCYAELFFSGKRTFHKIPFENLTASTITSLALDKQGNLYGGGYLTMSDAFKYNPKTKALVTMPEWIPYGEGQINTLFTGIDPYVFGVGYPNSVLFRYDPNKPWNPGVLASSNPQNFEGIADFRQMRAFKGVQAYDGSIWYESVSDFTSPISHALVKIEPSLLAKTVKTERRDKFPIVKDITRYDSSRLLFLGEIQGASSLFLLNVKDVKILAQKKVEGHGGLLINLNTFCDNNIHRIFFAQGHVLYQVLPDLSLKQVIVSPGKICKLLRGKSENDLFLIGKYFIQRIELNTMTSHLDWAFLKKEGGYIFKELTWLPAVYSTDLDCIFFADQQSLWRYTPGGKTK
jgi:hypothetical protein